jgi:hypothetical protein
MTVNTSTEDKMKITKRQLRRLIKEAISGHVHGDPNKPAFVDITMTAMKQGDFVKAAAGIMDSYMIDDTWPEEEQALVDMLTATPANVSVREVEAIADEWIQGKRAGTWNPRS